MHRERYTEKLMRVAATDGTHTWIYQFPDHQWKTAVRRIMADAKEHKLPDEAAGGILEMIAEGIDDD
jgi:hypothetical protein